MPGILNVNVTFEDIVRKTKILLGDNYKEPVVDTVDTPVDNTEQETRGADENTSDETEEITDLEDICAMVVREAAQWTNRFRLTDDVITDLLNDCWPVIVKCSCMAYLDRGAEGLKSQSELGQQNVYNDWVKTLHEQLTNRRTVI